jgi:nucleoside-diphosphate-sugar epimerase
MKNKILVMGCGHLFRFLQPRLKENHYEIIGASRSFSLPPDHAIPFTGDRQQLALLPSSGIQAVLWNFPPFPELLELLKTSNHYFAPSLPWIFVSSTSVYGDNNDSSQRDEQSPLSENSRLWPVENFLQTLQRPVCVLRPGGLVDSLRHPGNFFRARREVSSALTPVNLVHTEDLARFILHALKFQLWPNVYNVVAPFHPTRQEFYTQALAKLGHPAVSWSIIDSAPNRIIESTKSLASGFHYNHVDLSDLRD